MATKPGSLIRTVIANSDILQEKIKNLSPTQTTLNGQNLNVATVVAIAKFVYKSGVFFRPQSGGERGPFNR